MAPFSEGRTAQQIRDDAKRIQTVIALMPRDACEKAVAAFYAVNAASGAVEPGLMDEEVETLHRELPRQWIDFLMLAYALWQHPAELELNPDTLDPIDDGSPAYRQYAKTVKECMQGIITNFAIRPMDIGKTYTTFFTAVKNRLQKAPIELVDQTQVATYKGKYYLIDWRYWWRVCPSFGCIEKSKGDDDLDLVKVETPRHPFTDSKALTRGKPTEVRECRNPTCDYRVARWGDFYHSEGGIPWPG